MLDYYATRSKNREVFLLNFGDDVRAFDTLIGLLPRIWTRVGKERDTAGHSHAGLLLFANLVQRHALVGFEHIACFQTYLAWMTFRPGLEALLMVGKLVDDPKMAEVWHNRKQDPKGYRNAFSGKGLLSRSLPRGSELREVLARLNDNFVHANPDFAYRHQSVRQKPEGPVLEIGFFEKSAVLHEAHLLAFLNLLDILVSVSDELVEQLLGPPRCRQPGRAFSDFAAHRAVKLASDAAAARVMTELGFWKFSPSDEKTSTP